MICPYKRGQIEGPDMCDLAAAVCEEINTDCPYKYEPEERQWEAEHGERM